MSGIYNRSSEDRFYESMLNDYLDRTEPEVEKEKIETDEQEEKRVREWLEKNKMKFQKEISKP